MCPLQWEIRGVVPEDHGGRSGIHQRLLTACPAFVLYGTGFGFDPDQGSVGPTRRTMAFGTINGELLAMGRLRG